MQLHDAIFQVLRERGNSMSVKEITEAININSLASRHDGSPVCDFQVHGRSFNRQDLFIREGEMVSLRKRSKG